MQISNRLINVFKWSEILEKIFLGLVDDVSHTQMTKKKKNILLNQANHYQRIGLLVKVQESNTSQYHVSIRALIQYKDVVLPV